MSKIQNSLGLFNGNESNCSCGASLSWILFTNHFIHLYWILFYFHKGFFKHSLHIAFCIFGICFYDLYWRKNIHLVWLRLVYSWVTFRRVRQKRQKGWIWGSWIESNLWRRRLNMVRGYCLPFRVDRWDWTLQKWNTAWRRLRWWWLIWFLFGTYNFLY